MSQEILKDHLLRWQEKPVLREIYNDFYRRILENMVSGKTLEIGAGTGNLKEFFDFVISTDIISSAWVDCVCDAQIFPFQEKSFDNIIGVDVLHHIERPLDFFYEAQRILKNSGRIILLDPAITPLSWAFYHFLHEEPVILSDKPLEAKTSFKERLPFDANQAIPTLIFGKYRRMFEALFPSLKVIKKEYLSLWCYPLSGGFKKWSLIPSKGINSFLKFERKLEPFLGKLLGFRLMIVLEKKET
ncbi:MAG: class I SAM-dependent methyltransferase [Proteobacteria bacterium]|nr:class I SAM-dependent methyltransferase [Pseudomonadota bacterium]